MGFVPGPAGAPAPRGLLFWGNKHNDRKENLSLQAVKISRLDSASTRSGVRGRRQKTALFPRYLCLSKFCLLIVSFFFVFNVTVLRSFASENVQMLGPVGVVLTPRNAGLRADFSPSCIQLCCRQWLDGPLHKSGLRVFRKQKGKLVCK